MGTPQEPGQALADPHQADTSTTTDFLNIAGHELRAPVTALKGQLQLMQRRVKREGGRERDDEALTKMLYQVERMQQIVAVYLDSAYSARGVLSLMRQRADLTPMIERIVSIYTIGSARHPLRLEVTPTPLIGEFDSGRVDLVLRELLGNAFRFATEGEVVVRTRREGPMAYVEVEDAGPLIPTELAERIFQPYVTGPDNQNAGLGLGLAIARAVVRLHGGEMGLRKGDCGNVFWFTLPLERATE
ncbi:MAG: HAMP domain-containing histidine kinase [Chloroflexota bacterium]|nr:HAMP domain-containing histidine kinase [Chloroflexota bacterium]